MFDYIPNPLVVPIGLAIGIVVAAPVGPVNILCIQRALERGFLAGVVAGLGAVLGDAIIALLAGLGVGAITGMVENHRATIQIVGGIALIGFGVSLYFKEPQILTAEENGGRPTIRSYLLDIPKTFVLTVTNPGAVLGLFAIFGGIGSFVELRGYIDALFLVGAIALGSLAWWVFLSFLISRFRHRFDMRRLTTINRVAGTVLFAFGVMLIGEIALLVFPLPGLT
ncbi:MAG: LysE family translocator [Hyphomicrobiaceae bacterium]